EEAAVGSDEPVAVAIAIGDERRDGGVELSPAHGAGEAGVAEGEDPAVGGDHVVALARWCGDGAEDGAVEPGAAHVAEERCVAEWNHPSPVGEDPVALAGGGGGEADWLFTPGQRGRVDVAESGGVAQGL